MILVFYAGQLYEELTGFNDLKLLRINCDPEIYNGAYAFVRANDKWYRIDGTPVLLGDVPKELRLMVLLLT